MNDCWWFDMILFLFVFLCLDWCFVVCLTDVMFVFGCWLLCFAVLFVDWFGVGCLLFGLV